MKAFVLAAAVACTAGPALAVTVNPISIFSAGMQLAYLFSKLPNGNLDAEFKFNEEQDYFSASLTGASFDVNKSLTFGFQGDWWAITMTIDADAGFFWDSLSVGGTVQHTKYPDHGHGSSAYPWTYGIYLDADAWTDSHPLSPNNFVIATQPKPKGAFFPNGKIPHPGGKHVDTLGAIIEGTIDFDEDITLFTVVLSGSHPKVVPIPVPALLLGSALLALATLRRRAAGTRVAA